VDVSAAFIGGASRQDVIDGCAVLGINGTPYWCEARMSGDTCEGFTLRKFGGTADAYFVARNLRSCSCPHSNYNPTRPLGCKHICALRIALPTVTGRHAPAVAVAVA
jgi:hypothetical protein